MKKTMNPKRIYAHCYKLLENKTPLSIDCGKLCNAACCEDGELEEAGMYLFPFEDMMYSKMPKWLRIDESYFSYGEDDYCASIAICKGKCNRTMRPLACRIFPLSPYLTTDGELRIVVDPRAKAVCPLAKCYKLTDFEPGFVKRVEYIFKVLIEEKHVYNFVEALSELMDEVDGFLK